MYICRAVGETLYKAETGAGQHGVATAAACALLDLECVAGPPKSAFKFPDPCAHPKSRSTLGFYKLRHRSTRVQKWGIYLLDPPGGLGFDPMVLEERMPGPQKDGTTMAFEAIVRGFGPLSYILLGSPGAPYIPTQSPNK